MSNDQINFRSSPSNSSPSEIPRPLSTYDNLNDIKSIVPETESINTMGNKNVNEFPFSGISFRFDELKQLQQHQQPNASSPQSTSNGYDNIENNNFNTSNSSTNPNKQYINNINGNSNQMRQGHTVTTIAQNHSSASSSSSTTSSSDGYRSSNLNFERNKPVHSPAKSQFFGLHRSDENSNRSPPKRSQDDRENTGESSTVSDEEPLLHHFSNKIVATTSNHPSTSQYQNVPSISTAYYGQCTCHDGDTSIEIQQYDSEKFKCNYCLNGINVSTSGAPNSMANIDIASCSTSSKQITLDTSSNYRMSQSLSQVTILIGFN